MSDKLAGSPLTLRYICGFELTRCFSIPIDRFRKWC